MRRSRRVLASLLRAAALLLALLSALLFLSAALDLRLEDEPGPSSDDQYIASMVCLAVAIAFGITASRVKRSSERRPARDDHSMEYDVPRTDDEASGPVTTNIPSSHATSTSYAPLQVGLNIFCVRWVVAFLLGWAGMHLAAELFFGSRMPLRSGLMLPMIGLISPFALWMRGVSHATPRDLAIYDALARDWQSAQRVPAKAVVIIRAKPTWLAFVPFGPALVVATIAGLGSL